MFKRIYSELQKFIRVLKTLLCVCGNDGDVTARSFSFFPVMFCIRVSSYRNWKWVGKERFSCKISPETHVCAKRHRTLEKENRHNLSNLKRWFKSLKKSKCVSERFECQQQSRQQQSRNASLKKDKPSDTSDTNFLFQQQIDEGENRNSPVISVSC